MEKEDAYYFSNRRLRANRHIRELAAEVVLTHRDFIQPLFVDQSLSARTPLQHLNEIAADTPVSLIEQIRSDLQRGVTKFLIFPVPAVKVAAGFDYDFFADTVRKVKAEFGIAVWVAADLCLCAYTSHGHCGVLSDDGTKVLNKETVEELSRYALVMAKAGADCIAPSDMMDGRVAAIRKTLDQAGHDDVSIMSYSAKYSSQFYGPFRDACKSTPSNNAVLKDRKTYQLSSYSLADGLRSALRDQAEGADIVMVKPALPYLDVLARLKEVSDRPLAAYHVSGEYQ